MALNPSQIGVRVHRSPDGGEGAGGGGGAGGNENGGGSGNDGGGAGGGSGDRRRDRTERSNMPRMFSPNVEGQYRGFISRYGTGDEALEAASRYMWSELYTVRRRNKELRESLEAFERRVPPNSQVLVGDEVATFLRLKKDAGGSIANLEASLTRLKELETESANRSRSDVRKKAATALGYNPAVLEDRLNVTGLQLEVRDDAQADGSKKPVAYVRKGGDDKAPWEALGIVAERDWKDHLPALRVAPPDGSADDSSGSSEEETFVDFVETGAASGSKATGTSSVDSFLKKRDEQNKKRPNPLGAAKTGA